MKSNDNTVIHDRRIFPKGSILIHQDDAPTAAFLIHSGKVGISFRHGDHDEELAVLGPGEIVGEMALISENPRSATVKALEETVAYVITKSFLDERIEKSHPLIKMILSALVKRLARTDEELARRIKDIKDLKDTKE